MVWRWAGSGGARFKLPVNAKTGKAGSSTDPGAWSDYATAVATFEGGGYEGLAFALGEGRWAVDLDHCRDAESGVIEPWAASVIKRMDSYSEVSPSGTGVHVLMYGTTGPIQTGLKFNLDATRHIELYQGARYLTFTANHLTGTPDDLMNRAEAFLSLRADVESKRGASPRKDSVPREATKAATAAKATLGSSTLEDEEVLAKARASRAGEVFDALMAGETENYANDHSSADMALCGFLAFWTRCDPEQMDRIFRTSGLMRSKWDTRRGLETYGEKTVQLAINNCTEVYEGGDSSTETFKEKNRARRAAKVKGTTATLSPSSSVVERPPETREVAGSVPASGAISSDSEFDPPPAPKPLVRLKANHLDPPDNGVYPASTDADNAARMAARYDGKLIWCASQGWLFWDGRRWATGEEYAQRAAIETAFSIMVEAQDPRNTPEQAKALFAWSLKSRSRGAINAMLGLAQFHPTFFVKPETLDAEPFLFNVINGTLDLKTATLRPHDSADHLTKLAPVPYDATAVSELWDRVLADGTKGQEGLADFLRRAAGYSMTGSTREDAVFVLHGPGGTGKSTIVGAVKYAFGDYATILRSEALTVQGNSGHSEDIAVLSGARMVLAVEASESDKLREGLVKTLTGGDTIQASRKNKPSFTFVPDLKLWISTNHMPRVRSDDSGVWRRILKLSFERVFGETSGAPARDTTIRDALKSQHHQKAILAWAVRGCIEWQRDGLKPPDVVREATAELRRSMDASAEFFEQRCRFGGEVLWTSSEDIMTAYREYARDAGIPERFWVSSMRLGEGLSTRGARQQKWAGRRGWEGVTIVEDLP